MIPRTEDGVSRHTTDPTTRTRVRGVSLLDYGRIGVRFGVAAGHVASTNGAACLPTPAAAVGHDSHLLSSSHHYRTHYRVLPTSTGIDTPKPLHLVAARDLAERVRAGARMSARFDSRPVSLLFALLFGVAWMSVGAVVSTSLSVAHLTVTVLAAITTTLLALRYLLPARGGAA